MTDEDFAELQKKIQFNFEKRQLLKRALTHKSFSKDNNEKLEFLGDSVLNLTITTLVFKEGNTFNEGQLSRVRSNLVNQTALVKVARFISLDRYLYVGTALKSNNGILKDSVVADSLEAIFGAISLDGGFTAASDVIIKLYRKVLLKNVNLSQIDIRDSKGELQELMQKYGVDLPIYSVLKVSGPEHAPFYEVESSVNVCVSPEKRIKRIVSRGKSSSIKGAEQYAAKSMLDKIRFLEIIKTR
tara:strand:+ start:938 stop:1666 length:729 start_codon:yes stop_codon:yes gene_type:complete